MTFPFATHECHDAPCSLYFTYALLSRWSIVCTSDWYGISSLIYQIVAGL